MPSLSWKWYIKLFLFLFLLSFSITFFSPPLIDRGLHAFTFLEMVVMISLYLLCIIALCMPNEIMAPFGNSRERDRDGIEIGQTKRNGPKF
jgi:hypothetical protein